MSDDHGRGKRSSIREFEEEEVFSCLKMWAMDKAPCPDGFTMGFYIKCWDVVKRDIMETFKNFHSQGVFEKSSNATYIALIPKNGAKELRDFRPISLISSVYKLLSKVLTERLKRVITTKYPVRGLQSYSGRESASPFQTVWQGLFKLRVYRRQSLYLYEVGVRSAHTLPPKTAP